MKVREPTIKDYGLVVEHDMACPVHHRKPAVYCCDNGIFYPSWDAQREGWHLVHADSWFRRKVLRIVFGKDI